MRRISWIVIFSWLATTLVAQSELDRIKELLRNGETLQARQRLEPLLLKADANQAELHYLMGVIALQLEDYAKAVSHLRIATQADPNSAAILKLLVKAQLLSGQRLEVEASLQKAARLSPDDAEVWSLLGRLYQESSRFKEAVQPLERAVDRFRLGFAGLHLVWLGRCAKGRGFVRAGGCRERTESEANGSTACLFCHSAAAARTGE